MSQNGCPDPLRGVAWYVGVTQMGKSHLARIHAHQLATSRSVPVVAVDSAGTLYEYPLKTIAEVPRAAWGAKRCSVRIHPKDGRCVERVCAIARAGKSVVLLIDECGWWLDAHSGRSELMRVVRAWAHSDLDVLLTTQSVSTDVPQAALNCASAIYSFRQRAPASLRRLEDIGLDVRGVRDLPKHRFIRYRL